MQLALLAVTPLKGYRQLTVRWDWAADRPIGLGHAIACFDSIIRCILPLILWCLLASMSCVLRIACLVTGPDLRTVGILDVCSNGQIGESAAFLARILQFMETPQYLRRCSACPLCFVACHSQDSRIQQGYWSEAGSPVGDQSSVLCLLEVH